MPDNDSQAVPLLEHDSPTRDRVFRTGSRFRTQPCPHPWSFDPTEFDSEVDSLDRWLDLNA